MIKIFGKKTAPNFHDRTQLPDNKTQRLDWQKSNKFWWGANPMRYDFEKGIPYREFSKEFYEEIDRRFFKSAWHFIPWKNIPFDSLIDFGALTNKDVLEIGIGNGSHAKLLAQHAKTFTGIDITEYAVKSTSIHLSQYGLQGHILLMDAEKMKFDDDSFDFIWSWGVIHHSSDTRKALEEIHRVLRTGGKATVMVYHHSLWNYYIRGVLYYGISRGELFKKKSIDKIIQDHTDGALARYYTIAEWKTLLSGLFRIEKIQIFGSKSQLIPLPWGKAKEFLMSLMPDRVGRFLTNRPSIGFLLVSSFMKP
jgi:ubiquinone/menaquinone biosynthesis C-methylase UbiE